LATHSSSDATYSAAKHLSLSISIYTNGRSLTDVLINTWTWLCYIFAHACRLLHLHLVCCYLPVAQVPTCCHRALYQSIHVLPPSTHYSLTPTLYSHYLLSSLLLLYLGMALPDTLLCHSILACLLATLSTAFAHVATRICVASYAALPCLCVWFSATHVWFGLLVCAFHTTRALAHAANSILPPPAAESRRAGKTAALRTGKRLLHGTHTPSLTALFSHLPSFQMANV